MRAQQDNSLWCVVRRCGAGAGASARQVGQQRQQPDEAQALAAGLEQHLQPRHNRREPFRRPVLRHASLLCRRAAQDGPSYLPALENGLAVLALARRAEVQIDGRWLLLQVNLQARVMRVLRTRAMKDVRAGAEPQRLTGCRRRRKPRCPSRTGPYHRRLRPMMMMIMMFDDR
jgi:hypothetical protein